MAKSAPLKVVSDDPAEENSVGLSQVDHIIAKIVERIRFGEYAEGQTLVARLIAKEMNASVVPVREALARLAGEGVVELLQNRSPRVKKLSNKEVLDALEVWEVHAGLIARLAAQKINIRGNRALLKKTRKQIASIKKKKNRSDLFAEVIVMQEALGKIVDNQYIQRVTMSLHTELWTKRLTDAIPDKEWPAYVDDFIEIIDAIDAGNAKAAENAYRRHISNILESAETYLHER
ncbi:MAG: GntR family transcriptional regulator [Pseudomonadota bacterium]